MFGQMTGFLPYAKKNLCLLFRTSVGFHRPLPLPPPSNYMILLHTHSRSTAGKERPDM